MPHYYPVVFPAGRSLAGDSLGFHAYSFRVDNCTNQWYLEESTVSYIPPYSLGMCLRLYGTGVAILLAQAPVGQPQLAPIPGEQVVGVYSDQLRTEVAASPIRNFSLVQTVSDLTEGPQPGRPPPGTDRLYADTSGNIHHMHSDGTDLTLVDPSNAGTLLYPTFDPHYQAMMGATALGADLYGTVSAAHVGLRNVSPISAYDTGGTLRNLMALWNDNRVLFWNAGNNIFQWLTQAGGGPLMGLDASGNLSNAGTLITGGALTVTSNALYMTGIGQGPAAWLMSGGNLLSRMDGVWYFQNYAGSATRATLDTAGLFTSANLAGSSGTLTLGPDAVLQRWNAGQFRISSTGGLTLAGDATGGAGHGSLLLEGTGSGGNGPMIFWTNSGYWLTQYAAGLLMNGHTLYMWNNGGIYINHDGSNWGLAGGGLSVAGSISGQGVGVGAYCFTAPNAAAAYGQGYANAWINASSRQWKDNIAELDRALDLVMHAELHAVSYTHRGDGEHGAPMLGFVADDWAAHVPELVSFDQEGVPVGMDYARVGAITFEALKQYIARTDARLAALEGAA